MKLYNFVSVLDRNTWNHTKLCNVFAFDGNALYHIAVCKQLIIDKYKKLQFLKNAIIYAMKNWKYNYFYNQTFVK